MSDFEKEKQAFELHLKEEESTVKEDAFCTWADKPDRSFQPSFWDLAQSFYGGYHSRDEEITRLRAEIERKDELIEEALNQLYVDQDGIGDIDGARRILEQALQNNNR